MGDLHQIASDLEDSLAVARADSQMAIASVGSRHQWRMNILLHYTCKYSQCVLGSSNLFGL